MKSEKGITLAMLVTTIVVMLIMSSVIVVVSLDNSNYVTNTLDNVSTSYEQNSLETEEKINSIDEEWADVINKKGIENDIDNR